MFRCLFQKSSDFDFDLLDIVRTIAALCSNLHVVAVLCLADSTGQMVVHKLHIHVQHHKILRHHKIFNLLWALQLPSSKPDTLLQRQEAAIRLLPKPHDQRGCHWSLPTTTPMINGFWMVLLDFYWFLHGFYMFLPRFISAFRVEPPWVSKSTTFPSPSDKAAQSCIPSLGSLL